MTGIRSLYALLSLITEHQPPKRLQSLLYLQKVSFRTSVDVYDLSPLPNEEIKAYFGYEMGYILHPTYEQSLGTFA
jgi:hypothetical protein